MPPGRPIVDHVLSEQGGSGATSAPSRRTIQGHHRQAFLFAVRERVAVRSRLRHRPSRAPTRIIRARWGASGNLQGILRLTGGLAARRLSALSGPESTRSAGDHGYQSQPLGRCGRRRRGGGPCRASDGRRRTGHDSAPVLGDGRETPSSRGQGAKRPRVATPVGRAQGDLPSTRGQPKQAAMQASRSSGRYAGVGSIVGPMDALLAAEVKPVASGGPEAVVPGGK